MTTIRPLATAAEFAACVAIQNEVWGPDYSDVTPPVLFKIVQKVGGVALGAFDDHDECIGFLFGITGIEDGEVVHWSHQLGVRAHARNGGIGRRLKEYQREMLRALGVRRIYWTFDPLQAKNAHLNINRLGVEVADYVPDMYGAARSALFQGLNGTDRLIVAMDPAATPRTATPLSIAEARAVPTFGNPADAGARLRIDIPLEITALSRTDPDAAGRWRLETRPAFQWAIGNGYRIDCLVRDTEAGLAYYVLSRV